MSAESGKERRRLSRVKRRAKIKFVSGEGEYEGIILNFSEIGLFIQMDDPIPRGSFVNVPLGSGERGMVLQGKVIWSRADSHVLAGGHPGIGVELSASPKEYIQFIAKMRSDLQKAPRGVEERFEVYHRVSFKSGGAFLTEYTENLSRGGMFMATDKPLEPGSRIKAKIEIEGFSEPIEVEGRVAYQLDENTAQKSGRTTGCGIQFVDLSPEARSTLNHYIKRLEIHRARPERRMVEGVPSKGLLSEFLVPEILLYLVREKKTGTLTLRRKDIRKVVYLKDGKPVFVESSLPTEFLGQYLVRHGRITPLQLEESMKELAKRDVHHGEVMIQMGLVTQAELAEALVEHQEEKLLNTFPWFHGNFEFVAGTDWDRPISMFPLRVYQIFFKGIIRWYDANLIHAWMGINEENFVKKAMDPPQEASIPPNVYRLLRLLKRPHSIKALVAKLQMPLDDAMPAIYAFIVAGWAELHFTDTVAEEPIEELKEEVKPQDDALQEKLVKWSEEDYTRFKGMNFYELLGVSSEASDAELSAAFLDRSSRYAQIDINTIEDGKIRNRILQMRSWFQLAYDTLRDRNLRQVYARTGKVSSGPSSKNNERVEAARLLLAAVRDMSSGDLDKAISKLTLAKQMYPEDATIPGYLGWALFKKDASNDEEAEILLDQAIEGDPLDPQLRYYRGRIAIGKEDWRSANTHLTQALRLFPRFKRASEALAEVKKKLPKIN